MPHYLNGKFASQRMTGVQRVAWQLVQALDLQLQGVPGRWVLLCAPGAQVPPLTRIEVRHVGVPGAALHWWEQVHLPLAARNGLLVNLSGSAPYFARRQVALLHDAAVFDQPQAYSRTFVAWYRLLFNRLARRAERLFTVSVFSQTRLAMWLDVAPERFVILPNGCDHLNDVTPDEGVLAHHGLQGTRFLLAVASANPSKNLAALIAAFACLDTPAVKLVVVGGSNDRVFAQRDATADPQSVLRTGPLTDARLKALYQHAEALVFPSLYEGFGLPPLEAMACGCPAAVARAASLPEVCGEAAIYFDPQSVQGITLALQRLLAEPFLRERLRRDGLQRAAHWRWSASAAQLLAALPPERRA